MKTITKAELEKKKNSIHDLTLINTLPAKYFEDYKIPGSINIPQDQDDFVERVALTVMNNKDAEIVVYCANQECDSSARAANKLEAAGFNNVRDFEGGATEWNASQSETVASE